MKSLTMKISDLDSGSRKRREFSVCALLICAALGCTACSGNASGTGAADNTAEDKSDQSEANTSVESTEASDENTEQDNGAADGTSENDTPVTSVKSNIDIQMQKEEDNKTTEDGVVYYTRYAEYPVVTMEGNAEAAKKINADIHSRIEESKANSETEEWAEELLQDIETLGPDFVPVGYSDGLTFQTVRADSNVIAFRLLYETYSGGAHGNYTSRGANYNAKTGELISFSALSDDPAAFREDTLSYNQKLAETESYSERMFSSDDITNGTLESVLYADDAWYLSTSGLVFISDPYALGPYAAGTIEFIIPYSDLADMGFQESYTYSDRFVMKIQPHETCTASLNGDGTDDSILSYTEDATNEDGTYNPRPHLIINDTDLATDSAAETQESLAHFAVWADLTLYDLNPDDAYIELVYVSWDSSSEEEADYGYYSHFYRYMEDNTLVYLGSAKGDITDPTVDVSTLN